MEISILNQKLPKVYKRDGKDCYLDPIRKKLVNITPEETIRQKLISFLLHSLNVPENMILVEEHLSHFGIQSNRRADIIVLKPDDKTLAVIECKAPGVFLDDKACDQIVDYCNLIEADYGLLTNGMWYKSFRYDEPSNSYQAIEELPTYNEMISGEYKVYDTGELPERINFENIESFLKSEFESYEQDYYGEDISKTTPMNLAAPVFNLLECLYDTRVKMPVGNYGLFELIEDYGVRMLSYGNASGGVFYGPYRSFLIKIGGNTEFFSISSSAYTRKSNPDNVKTCIIVAHDDEKETHHALQLAVEDNVERHGNRIDFYHSGRIAIGNIGSGKIDGLRKFVAEKYPKIISGNRFYLGSVEYDRLWYMDDPQIIELITNLISYSIIRDEYRKQVKAEKSK